MKNKNKKTKNNKQKQEVNRPLVPDERNAGDGGGDEA